MEKNSQSGSRYSRSVRRPVTIARKPVLRSDLIKSKSSSFKKPAPPKKTSPAAEPSKEGSTIRYELDAAEARALDDELQEIMIQASSKKPAHSKRTAPPAAPSKEGFTTPRRIYKLGAAKARALEVELQEIMMQVWQALPDNAPTDEEKMVVKKFKNEASDDLRNAMGLYVTQRLLNKFNPLNVKVHFSTKPDRKYLRAFLKRYNFVAFKRIVRVNNTFAAQVKTIADYDALCSKKNMYCGAAKLTISPCYRFTQCPKNLKSIYGIPEDDDAPANKDDKGLEGLNVSGSSSNETKAKNEESQEKSATDKAKESAVNKVEQSKPTSKEDDKIKPEPIFKVPVSKATPSTATESAKTAPKAAEAKPKVVAESKPTTATKPVENKPQNTPVTKSADNAQKQNTTVTKKIETASAKVIEDGKSTTTNANTKTTTTNINAKTTTTNTNTKTPTENTNIKNTTENTNIKNTTTTSNTNTSVAATKPSDVKDDKKVAPTTTSVANKKPVVVSTPKPTESKETKPTTTEAANTKTPNANTTKPADAKNDKPPADNTKAANTSAAKPTVAKPTAANSKTVTPVKTNKVAPTKVPETKKVTNPKQATKKVDSKKQTDTKKTSKGDDFEELDDNELYQYLMSAGIVLDECSGSDDE